MAESGLSVYLRSVAHLYPGGIPRVAVQAPRVESAGQPTVLFLSCEAALDPACAPFADPAGALLQAAIEKGLRLSVDVVEVLRSGDPAVIQSRYQNSGARFVVLLGAAAAAAVGVPSGHHEGLTEHNGKQLLCTVELSRSVVDAAAKRQFWQDLQPLVSLRIHEHTT
ncbi:MAG: hypothetical protein EBZ48_09775 [Proteobacteria bacterium]|nr:hypothetical protein [Pseudomonadota bacterium]